MDKENDDRISLQLRLPKNLHSALEEVAKLNERSLNGEIVWRLKHSFEQSRNDKLLQKWKRMFEELHPDAND
jgi:hypothetical protein